MTFVFFAHKPDQKLLEQSARNLRRLYSAPKIIVYWESGKEGYLEGAENLISRFDRGGNLNGLECCQGIIDCLIETGEERVFKIDSDTILAKPLPDFKGFLFYESVMAFCGVGCCYGIDREVLKLCKEKLNGYSALPNCQYSEDLTLSVLCQNVARGELKLWNKAEHVIGYAYDKNWDFYASKTVIHMGNPDRQFDPRLKKARDAAHMKLFVDWLEQNA